MATAAERQRRYRAHKRGDHTLCDPNRGCNGVTPVTGGSAGSGPAAPTGLGARGHRLWAALAESIPGPAHLVLVEEACRIADRLDRLDRALADSTDAAWMRFQVNEGGTEVTVVVDRVLAEARQQAVALKQLVAELRQSARPARPSTRSVGGVPGRGASGVADLSARIAARRGAPAG